MSAYRERPRCRRVINHLLEKHDCDLEDLLSNRFCFLGRGMRLQCEKMLRERREGRTIDFRDKSFLYKRR